MGPEKFEAQKECRHYSSFSAKFPLYFVSSLVAAEEQKSLQTAKAFLLSTHRKVVLSPASH